MIASNLCMVPSSSGWHRSIWDGAVCKVAHRSVLNVEALYSCSSERVSVREGVLGCGDVVDSVTAAGREAMAIYAYSRPLRNNIKRIGMNE